MLEIYYDFAYQDLPRPQWRTLTRSSRGQSRGRLCGCSTGTRACWGKRMRVGRHGGERVQSAGIMNRGGVFFAVSCVPSRIPYIPCVISVFWICYKHINILHPLHRSLSISSPVIPTYLLYAATFIHSKIPCTLLSFLHIMAPFPRRFS